MLEYSTYKLLRIAFSSPGIGISLLEAQDSREKLEMRKIKTVINADDFFTLISQEQFFQFHIIEIYTIQKYYDHNQQ